MSLRVLQRLCLCHHLYRHILAEINYSTVLPGTKEEKKILHNIQGSANPGEVLAVLGTSGAGQNGHHLLDR